MNHVKHMAIDNYLLSSRNIAWNHLTFESLLQSIYYICIQGSTLILTLNATTLIDNAAMQLFARKKLCCNESISLQIRNSINRSLSLSGLKWNQWGSFTALKFITLDVIWSVLSLIWFDDEYHAVYYHRNTTRPRG